MIYLRAVGISAASSSNDTEAGLPAGQRLVLRVKLRVLVDALRRAGFVAWEGRVAA